MNKYKICVYAICKNEEKNILSWVESMKEADEIYVLDTGSTDNSIKLLNDLGVKVKSLKIDPWRFDEARNKSLELVPKDADICVCTDLDERFNKGWRKKLEEIWKDNQTRLGYLYNWSFNEYGLPATTFYISKIHTRNNYKWINRVHEVLSCDIDEIEIKTDQIILNHYQDINKSRASYLPLLEQSVKDNPENDRNMHYLGREYMYYKRWNECIDTLIKHLNLKTATWKDERCASMRYIARCYIELERINEAIMWYKLAINESPYLREPYYELGYLYYSNNMFLESKGYLIECLKIKDKSKSYLNEYFCWNGSIYDILSICEFNLGNTDEAIRYAELALKQNPYEKRIKENIKIMKSIKK